MARRNSYVVDPQVLLELAKRTPDAKRGILHYAARRVRMLRKVVIMSSNMSVKKVRLYGLLPEPALVVEHPSRVLYENRVGGAERRLEQMEGVLVPACLEPDAIERFRSVAFSPGIRGISKETADAIDAIFMSQRGTSFLRVDRGRREESCSGWVYIAISSPETTVIELYKEYFGKVYGFGNTRGVMTWNQ